MPLPPYLVLIHVQSCSEVDSGADICTPEPLATGALVDATPLVAIVPASVPCQPPGPRLVHTGHTQNLTASTTNEESAVASVLLTASQVLGSTATPLVAPSTPTVLPPVTPLAPRKLARRSGRGKKLLSSLRFAPLDWATAAAPPSLSGAELRFPKPIAPWDAFVAALEAKLSRGEKAVLSKRGIAPAEPVWWRLSRSSVILVNFVRKRLQLGAEIGQVVLTFWIDVLISAGFEPCEGLVAWAVDAQNLSSSKLVAAFVAHTEWAARSASSKEQPLWATLFTVASLRARALISRVGAPAAATPSHGAKKWGRPNRNKVLLAAKTRVVLLNDDTISQSSGPGPILSGSLDHLPSGGGEGGASVDLSADANPPTSSRVVILPEALEAATAEAVVSLAVTVQLPSSPIRELPSPTSPAAPTLTGWGSDNEEADERTGSRPL